MARTLINVPPKAKRGQIIEIKTLISHVMETGYRRNETGVAIPRDIINLFVCTYNGTEIFRADLHQAIAANPFITFFTMATESGTPRVSAISCTRTALRVIPPLTVSDSIDRPLTSAICSQLPRTA